MSNSKNDGVGDWETLGQQQQFKNLDHAQTVSISSLKSKKEMTIQVRSGGSGLQRLVFWWPVTREEGGHQSPRSRHQGTSVLQERRRRIWANVGEGFGVFVVTVSWTHPRQRIRFGFPDVSHFALAILKRGACRAFGDDVAPMDWAWLDSWIGLRKLVTSYHWSPLTFGKGVRLTRRSRPDMQSTFARSSRV